VEANFFLPLPSSIMAVNQHASSSRDSALERSRSPLTAMSNIATERLNEIVRPTIISNKKPLTNWGGSFVCRPTRLFAPTTVEQCCAIIELARRAGGIEVRAVGRIHSPGDITFTNDWIIRMDQLKGLLSIDHSGPSITVLAGTFVSDMHTILETASPPLAMYNLGSISEQTIGGLISTATHGTGIKEPVISTAVQSMRVICPISTKEGGTQVLTCSRDENAELFNATLCGLGATGLIIEVTIKVDHLFKLKQVSEECPFDFIFGERTEAPYIELPGTSDSHTLLSSDLPQRQSIGKLLANGYRLSPAIDSHWPTTRIKDPSAIYPVSLDEAIHHGDDEDDETTRTAQRKLEAIANSSRHVRMAWFPTVGMITVSRADRTLEPFQTPGILAQWHHRLIGYHLSELLIYLSRYSTSLPPRINRAIHYMTAPSPPSKKNEKAPSAMASDEPSPVIKLNSTVGENDDHLENIESFTSGGSSQPLDFASPTIESGPEPLDSSHAITTLVDTSHRVFNVDCLFAQNTDEWAIPLCHAASAIRAMRDWIEEEERLYHGERVHFPVEVRFADGDGIWMSHCQGRKTCFIGLTKYRPYNQPTRYRKLFHKFELLMRHYAGRPHWAKAHSCGPVELHRLYPHMKDYLKTIEEYDPQGVLRNPYIRRHLYGDLSDDASPRIFKSRL
jgi:L-gulonolactone oxidase